MLVNSPAVTVNNYTNTSEILESLIILPLIVTDDVTAMCIRSSSLTDTGVLVGVELVAAAAATLVRARSIDARLLTPALVALIAFVDIYMVPIELHTHWTTCTCTCTYTWLYM